MLQIKNEKKIIICRQMKVEKPDNHNIKWIIWQI
jgi:hypothetical protein